MNNRLEIPPQTVATIVDAVETEVSPPRPEFHINDLGSLNWLVRKLNEQAQRAEDAKAWAGREVEESKKARAGLLERFGAEAEEFTRSQLDGKKKSISIPAGKVGFRSQADKLAITNEAEVINWCAKELPKSLNYVATFEVNTLPAQAFEEIEDILRRHSVAATCTCSLRKTALNEHFKATGEIPPGCELIPGGEKFYVD